MATQVKTQISSETFTVPDKAMLINRDPSGSGGATSTNLLNQRYERRERIGDGSYGIVYKCWDRETETIVAIKKWKDNDKDSMIKKMAMQEIAVLQQLKHVNLVNLLEIFRQRNRLHFVLEFCDMTALDVMQKHKKGVPGLITKSVTWQTLQALNYFHKQHYLHRDVKPENILIRKDGLVKLCDFNFARVALPGAVLTDYVATRWYRAPELLVGETKYDAKVDVWALGCVFAEFVKSEPLWPGKSDLDQLYIIRRNLGDLLPRHMEIFKNNTYFYGLTIPDPGAIVPLEKKVPTDMATVEGMKFLKKCVDKDPSKRPSCEQLLKHPYFKGYSFKYPQQDKSTSKSSPTKDISAKENSILPQLPGSMNSASSKKNNGSNKIKYH